MKHRLIALVAITALFGGLGTAGRAAEPPAGTVDPQDAELTWNGQNYAAAATVDPEACPPAEEDPEDVLCDHFKLTVDVTKSYWDDRAGGASVTISWPDAEDDFDLYIYKNGNRVASSAQGGTTSEQTLIPEAFGTYEVRVLPFLVTESGYKGTAKFVQTKLGPITKGGPQAYHGVRITGENPKQEPQSTPARYGGPPLLLQTTDVGREAAEPTIGIDKSNTAFYAAATFDSIVGTAKTEFLRSKDGGLTWENITPEPGGGGEDQHPTTFDPYVFTETNSGRTFFIDLLLTGAELSFTDDKGETYKSTLVTDPRGVNDHQTIFSGPVPKGAPLTTVDPAFKEIVYYCVNQVSESSCTRSLDGGLTFTPTGEPAYPGVNPDTGQTCGGLHGHVRTDGKGRVFVPRGYCRDNFLVNEIPTLSISNDAGTTWTRSTVSDKVKSKDHDANVAVDSEDNLYYTYWDKKHELPYLATSTDHGKTWSDPLMIAPPGVHEATFPTIVAGDRGRIAITFPGTTVTDDTDLTRPWNSYVAISTNALSKNPLFVSNIANKPNDPVHRGECPDRCGNMFDFLDIQMSPADGAVWATAVDTCTDKRNCNTERKIGFDGDEDNASRDMRGLAIRQLSGPSLVEPPSPRACKTRIGAEPSGKVIVGTNQKDLITGTNRNDIICSLGEQDIVDGLAGQDLIVLGADSDTARGGDGKDDIRGGSGSDTVSAGSSHDTVTGQGGNDQLKGNKGIDTLRGNSGDDTLQGGADDDILRGGRNDDSLRGFTGDDILDGDSGTDQCKPGKGDDLVRQCE